MSRVNCGNVEQVKLPMLLANTALIEIVFLALCQLWGTFFALFHPFPAYTKYHPSL